jgi:hypothetical protein
LYTLQCRSTLYDFDIVHDQRNSAASNPKRDTVPARLPCCGPPQQRVLKFPRLQTVPFWIYRSVHTPGLRASTRVRKCLPRRGRCITIERRMDPPPSRHAETLLKSTPTGFYSAARTGLVVVQRATQRPTAVPTRILEAALGVSGLQKALKRPGTNAASPTTPSWRTARNETNFS